MERGRLWNGKWPSLRHKGAEFKVQRCRVPGAKVPTSGCKGAEFQVQRCRVQKLRRAVHLIAPPAAIDCTARSSQVDRPLNSPLCPFC